MAQDSKPPYVSIERAKSYLAERPEIIKALEDEKVVIQARLKEIDALLEELGATKKSSRLAVAAKMMSHASRSTTWDEYLSKLPELPLPTRIAEALRANPDQDAVSLAEALGMADQRPIIHTTLSRMRKKGQVVTSGPPGSRTYRLAPQVKAAASAPLAQREGSTTGGAP